jgi:hypothetical protein
MIAALRVSARPFARMLSTTSSAPATVKATTEAASAAASTPGSHYITFAEYRQQATKQGPLAAVRQAYPRSLNTASEIARAKAAATAAN